MAAVALRVCCQISWNGKCNTAVERTIVTSNATVLRASSTIHVLRMIKLNIETFLETRRKIPEWRLIRTRVSMADEAHRNTRSHEL